MFVLNSVAHMLTITVQFNSLAGPSVIAEVELLASLKRNSLSQFVYTFKIREDLKGWCVIFWTGIQPRNYYIYSYIEKYLRAALSTKNREKNSFNSTISRLATTYAKLGLWKSIYE